ncbi:type II secretion system protein [Nitrospira sp. M1]
MKDKNQTTTNRQSEAGFALIALLGVLAIVVSLATVLLPNMFTSLNMKANEAEKDVLQDIGLSSTTYLRSTHTWAPTLAAHTGYSPLDSAQLLQNDRLFPRYYALHPSMGGFNNGAGLAEVDLADARFLLISNRTADAAPTITNAAEFTTWWTTDESVTPDFHIYRANLADMFLRVSLTAEGDGGSYQIGGVTTNSGGGTLPDYMRYHLPGTIFSLDEDNTYGTPEVQFALTGNVAYQFDPLCAPGSQWRVLSAPPCLSSIVLWLSTQGTTSDAPGLDSWTDSQIVSFDNPNLTYDTGPTGQTSGTFASITEMSNFGIADIDAGHYVNASMTVGGVTLNEGDLLLSTDISETLISINSLSVNDEDVFIFRPVSLDDYSSGTFFMFIDASDVGITGDIEALTFVEMNTSVAGQVLLQGDVLFFYDGRDIYHFSPTSLGSTTSGAVNLLIDGSDIRISEQFEGLELIEEQTNLGDITLQAGQILASFEAGDSDLGDNQINVDVTDIVILDLTSVGSNTVGTATIVFDGADVALTTTSEGTDSIMIKGSPSTIVVLSITNPGFETGDLTGWTKTGDLTGNGGHNGWGARTSTGAMSVPHGGTYFGDARADDAVTGAQDHELGVYQRLDVAAYVTEIDAGKGTTSFSGFGHGETPGGCCDDKAKLRITFYDAVAGGLPIGASYDSVWANTTETWDQLSINDVPVPAGTRSIELLLLGRKEAGGSKLDGGIDDVRGTLMIAP